MGHALRHQGHTVRHTWPHHRYVVEPVNERGGAAKAGELGAVEHVVEHVVEHDDVATFRLLLSTNRCRRHE